MPVLETKPTTRQEDLDAAIAEFTGGAPAAEPSKFQQAFQYAFGEKPDLSPGGFGRWPNEQELAPGVPRPPADQSWLPEYMRPRPDILAKMKRPDVIWDLREKTGLPLGQIQYLFGISDDELPHEDEARRISRIKAVAEFIGPRRTQEMFRETPITEFLPFLRGWKASQYLRVKAATERPELLGSMSPAEAQEIVDAYELQQERGENLWATVAKGVATLPAYWAEFAAIPEAALVKAPLAAGRFVRLGIKVANAAAKAGVVTTLQPGIVAESLTSQMRRGIAGPRAILMAYGDVFVGNLTEMSGDAFPVVGKAILDQLPFGGKLLKLMEARAAKKGLTKDQFLNVLANRAAWNGFVEEYSEEELNVLLAAIFDLNDYGAGPDASIFDRVGKAFEQDLKLSNQLAKSMILLTPGGIRRVGQFAASKVSGAEKEELQRQFDVLVEESKQAAQEYKAEQGITPQFQPPVENLPIIETKVPIPAEQQPVPAPAELEATRGEPVPVPLVPTPAAETVEPAPGGVTVAVPPSAEQPAVAAEKRKAVEGKEVDAQAVLTPDGKLSPRVFRNTGPTGIWWYQGNPQRFVSQQGPEVSSEVKRRVDRARAALDQGYQFKEYPAGEFGFMSVLEKDGNVLTNAGLEGMQKGQPAAVVPSEEAVAGKEPTWIEQQTILNAQEKDLRDKINENMGQGIGLLFEKWPKIGKDLGISRTDITERGAGWFRDVLDDIAKTYGDTETGRELRVIVGRHDKLIDDLNRVSRELEFVDEAAAAMRTEQETVWVGRAPAPAQPVPPAQVGAEAEITTPAFGRTVQVSRRGAQGEAVEWIWPNVGTITKEKIKGKMRYVARTKNEEFRALTLDSAIDRMASTIPELQQSQPAPTTAQTIPEAQATVAPGPEATWGVKNTGVTRAEYEAIKAKLAKSGKLQGGRQAGGTILFSPEEWSDLLRVGRFHLEAGARVLADWAKRMVDDFGEGIRPKLDELWNEINTPVPPGIKEQASGEPLPPSAAKNADSRRIRQMMGLDGIPSPEKKANAQSLQEAIEKGTPANAVDIALEVIGGERDLREFETIGLKYRQLQLSLEMNRLDARAKETVIETDKRDIESQRKTNESQQELILRALIISGTNPARALQIRKFIIDNVGDASNNIVRAEINKGKGQRLTEEERARIEKLTADYNASQAEIDRLRAELIRIQAGKGIKEQGMRRYAQMDTAQKDAEYAVLKEKLTALIAAGC